MSVGAETQQSSSETSSFIDPGQQAFLSDLWGQAQGLTNAPGAQQGAAGIGAGTMPGMMQGFNNTVGLGNPQGQIDAQTASLQAGLGQLFNEEINPAITSNAIAAGGLGGGRQGVAQGVAAGQIGQAFTQGLGDITAQANQTALAANSGLGGMVQNMFQANQNQFGGGLDQLSRLAQILGSPTVLGSSTSGSSGSSASFGIS